MGSTKSYWLMKSEPDVFSIDDLARDKTTSLGWGPEFQSTQLHALDEAR